MAEIEYACPDCWVGIGDQHDEGCDDARCWHTGRQRLGCDGGHSEYCDDDEGNVAWNPDTCAEFGCSPHDCGQATWTGRTSNSADAERLGWYSRGTTLGRPPWVRCGPEHPDAYPDTHRLVREAVWNREARQWQARPDTEEASRG